VPNIFLSVQPKDFADQTVGWNNQPGSQKSQIRTLRKSRYPEAPKQPEIIIEILFAEAKVLRDNDPSAGAPTETLLRIFFFL